MYKNSKVIILDEITSNLDKKTENEILENLKEISKNRLVILISHSPNLSNIWYLVKECSLLKLSKRCLLITKKN